MTHNIPGQSPSPSEMVQLFFGAGLFLSTHWKHFHFHRKILHNQWRHWKSFLCYCGCCLFEPESWLCSSFFNDWFSSIANVAQKLSTILPISAVVKKYLSRAFWECAMPLIPPVTFSAWFSCSIPWSDPMEENGTFDLLTENPLLDRNS